MSRKSPSRDALLALLDEDERLQLLADLGVCDERALEGFSCTTILAAVLGRRKPFVRMMSEIARVLAEIDARLPGKVEVITLPGSVDRLRLTFGSQLRGYLALCADEQLFTDAAMDLQAALRECRAHIERAIEECVPQAVHVSSPYFPWGGEMPYAVARRAARRLEELFNADDLAFFVEARNLLRAGNDIAARVVAEMDELTQSQMLRDDLRELADVVGEKIALMERRVDEDGNTEVHLLEADKRASLERLRLFNETLARVCKRGRAFDELMDFLSLEIWRHRWRVFELWSLCRLVQVILDRGGMVRASDRIKDGEWTLKYARDSKPCLEIDLMGTALHVFYQLHRSTGHEAHMPDIALEMPGEGFVVVADPKHGKTYTCASMERICRRYRRAFTPIVSCVMNYFPGNTTWQLLEGDPGMVVATDMTPDSQTASLFNSAVDDALGTCLAAIRVAGAVATSRDPV